MKAKYRKTSNKCWPGGTLNLAQSISLINGMSHSSDRQHLSYDVCIIRTVLCCIVYWRCAQS